LTFDDGPDPASTPAILDELAALRVHATFFVLGTQLVAHPRLGRRIADTGHEVAVHGWTHRPHLLRTPWDVEADLRRAYDCVRDTTGATPRYWRPPNGIVTGAGLRAARRLQLTPVLWTADGRDWARSATSGSVAARVIARLDAGGTVLLHDSDVTSAPLSWRSALGSLRPIVEHCAQRGWPVGPMREHWHARSAERG
jgi:peptidoglycan/xylan/chitin deacetylase (PgdA/CDA1 family)